MKTLLLGLAAITVLTSGCTQVPAEMPDDFSLRLEWNTGALPPQYTYMYTVTIGPGQQGKLEYRPGYDPEDDTHFWLADFTPEKDQMAAFYDYLQENDLMRDNWKKGQLLLGSSGTSITLTAYGKTYQIPSIAELDKDERVRAEAAMDAIRSLVPQALWDEMETRQAAYEAAYEE